MKPSRPFQNTKRVAILERCLARCHPFTAFFGKPDRNDREWCEGSQAAVVGGVDPHLVS